MADVRAPTTLAQAHIDLIDAVACLGRGWEASVQFIPTVDLFLEMVDLLLKLQARSAE